MSDMRVLQAHSNMSSIHPDFVRDTPGCVNGIYVGKSCEESWEFMHDLLLLHQENIIGDREQEFVEAFGKLPANDANIGLMYSCGNIAMTAHGPVEAAEASNSQPKTRSNNLLI